MSYSVHDPALVAAVVEQVLKTLQSMSLSSSAPTTKYDDSEEGVLGDFVELGACDASVAPSPAPSPVPDAAAVYMPAPVAPVTSTFSVVAPATVPPTTANAAQETWYMVSTGHAVGVFRGWHIVKPLVVGVSGACFKKYQTQAAAFAAFSEAQAADAVTIVPRTVTIAP